MGKIEFRFDKISICACPYLLFVLPGFVAAEIIAKIEDFARKKTAFSYANCEKNSSRFCSPHLVFTRSFSSGFFDGLGVEYSTFPKFVYIFYSSYLLKSENLSKRLNNFDFPLDDPLVVIVYAVVVCIIFRR